MIIGRLGQWVAWFDYEGSLSTFVSHVISLEQFTHFIHNFLKVRSFVSFKLNHHYTNIR